MQVKCFTDQIIECANEVQCTGKGKFGSHEFSSSVVIYDTDYNEYEIMSIEETRLTCGCADGIRIIIKKI